MRPAYRYIWISDHVAQHGTNFDSVLALAQLNVNGKQICIVFINVQFLVNAFITNPLSIG
jgi:hypothetical protein